jgi:hypothetical protein
LHSLQVKVQFKSSVADTSASLEEAAMAGLMIGELARQAGIAAPHYAITKKLGCFHHRLAHLSEDNTIDKSSAGFG